MNATTRPTSTTRRLLIVTVTVLVLLLGTLPSLAPSAQAQSAVVGGADFRDAPQLPPGQYVDRIVTGDSAWYAVMYTNGTPYEFQVDFQGQNPGSGFDLNVSFVAPTLTTVDGPSATVVGDGVDYPAGHTNVWFLKVSLDTTDQVGVEYPISISVDGVRSETLEDCSDIDGCVLDDEYAAINVALAEATAAFELAQTKETLEGVEAEIENLRGFVETGDILGPAAQARLASAEATVAELCAPVVMCDEFPDPPSKTPLIGWILGLGALGFGGYRAFKKFTSDPDPAPPGPRELSALERAKAEQKAARSRAKSGS